MSNFEKSIINPEDFEQEKMNMKKLAEEREKRNIFLLDYLSVSSCSKYLLSFFQYLRANGVLLDTCRDESLQEMYECDLFKSDFLEFIYERLCLEIDRKRILELPFEEASDEKTKEFVEFHKKYLDIEDMVFRKRERLFLYDTVPLSIDEYFDENLSSSISRLDGSVEIKKIVEQFNREIPSYEEGIDEHLTAKEIIKELEKNERLLELRKEKAISIRKRNYHKALIEYCQNFLMHYSKNGDIQKIQEIFQIDVTKFGGELQKEQVYEMLYSMYPFDYEYQSIKGFQPLEVIFEKCVQEVEREKKEKSLELNKFLYRADSTFREKGQIISEEVDKQTLPEDQVAVGSKKSSEYKSTTMSYEVMHSYAYDYNNPVKKGRAALLAIDVNKLYEITVERLIDMQNIKDFCFKGELEFLKRCYMIQEEKIAQLESESTLTTREEAFLKLYIKNQKILKERIEAIKNNEKIVFESDKEFSEGIVDFSTYNHVQKYFERREKSADHNKEGMTQKYAPASAEVLFRGKIPKEVVTEIPPILFDIIQVVGSESPNKKDGKAHQLAEILISACFKTPDMIQELITMCENQLEENSLSSMFFKEYYINNKPLDKIMKNASLKTKFESERKEELNENAEKFEYTMRSYIIGEVLKKPEILQKLKQIYSSINVEEMNVVQEFEKWQIIPNMDNLLPMTTQRTAQSLEKARAYEQNRDDKKFVEAGSEVTIKYDSNVEEPLNEEAFEAEKSEIWEDYYKASYAASETKKVFEKLRGQREVEK